MPWKDKEKRREWERKRNKGRQVYIPINKYEEMGLPLRSYKSYREDGHLFKHYYYNIKSDGTKSICELWLSPTAVEKERERRRKSARRSKEFIARVKRKLSCSVCGYNKCPDALQFHHLEKENKHRAISEMSRSCIASLKKEIRKCSVLCANCHAEEHYNERINNT
jgi:hypothetical protein